MGMCWRLERPRRFVHTPPPAAGRKRCLSRSAVTRKTGSPCAAPHLQDERRGLRVRRRGRPRGPSIERACVPRYDGDLAANGSGFFLTRKRQGAYRKAGTRIGIIPGSVMEPHRLPGIRPAGLGSPCGRVTLPRKSPRKPRRPLPPRQPRMGGSAGDRSVDGSFRCSSRSLPKRGRSAPARPALQRNRGCGSPRNPFLLLVGTTRFELVTPTVSG